MEDIIWVFNGEKGHFPSGVFSTKELAEEWIAANQLTGILTPYPLDIAVYNWAVQNGHFTPSKDTHRTPKFIQQFSSASQEHYHYENGTDPALENLE